MPKSLAKTKHGRKASVQEQSASSQRELLPKSTPGTDVSSQPNSTGVHLHNKGTKHSSASSRVERRRDRLLKKLCDKASVQRSSSPVVANAPPEGRIHPPPTPDQISLQDCPLDIQTADLWGTAPALPTTVTAVTSATSSATEPPTPSISAPVRASAEAGPAQDLQQTVFRPEDIQQMIAAAVHQSLAAHLISSARPKTVHALQSDHSVSPDREDVEDSLSIAGSDSPAPSCVSRPSAFEDLDTQGAELSEDEGLPPDQPPFTGLFPQALFKSLLFKAINTAQLGTAAQPDPATLPGSINPLFAEPPKPVTAIPTPPLFFDVIRKQWSTPASAPVPSTTDRTNFTVSPDLTSLLQVPTVDTPVAALLSNSSVPGDPEEGLRPEERRSEQVLQRAHQGAAWAIRSATTASFFNRSTLLWL